MELSLLNCFRGPFVVLCHVALLHAALAATDPVEVDALKSFRSNIVKDPLSQLNDWKGDDPCGSSWNGVICKFDNKTQMQHVNEIRLMNIGLMGTLAPDLGNLSRLYILNVMWNNFSGSIPPEIGNLSNLFLLLLNGNNLTGTLPDSLGNLRNLNRIQIDQNKISGPVPKTFANLNNAKHFHMNNNSLSGTIPSELGSLQNLVHLLLDNNNLNGPLPPEISNISTLLIVQLDNNHFSGGIPSSYSNMFSLTKLSLRNCNLNGSIPDLSKLSDVGVIDLSHNNLSGPLPSGKLSDKLTTIDMSHNQLSGEIPSVYADLPNLQNLVLRNNLLNGTVPQITKGGLILSSTSKLLLDLQYNHFSANNFTNPPSHVVIRLYGNEWCDRNPSSECIPTDTGITGTFQNVSTQNASSSCTEDICDTSRNQELFVFQGGCVCSFPVFVGYRLKSPGFSYFGPFENAFNVYLSGGLKLSTDQVKVKNYTWEPGPRLHMNLNLFPAHNMTREFNSSEWRRLYDLFTNWQIPDNNTFGPYEVLSFPIQFPYSETFNTGSSRGLTGGAIAGIAVGSAALTAIVAAIFVIAYVRKQHYIASTTRKRGRNVRNEKIKVFGVKDFTFEEMSLATNNFSSSMQVGQGGYGKVYKGILADGQVVAIKRAQEGSLQGSKEFYTEIELLSRVHHRNLVSLVGYCDDEGEQMLVYEFMANGTLRDHLSSNAKWPFDFQSRLQIALGSARGILYLHTEANPPIFHRDIKASNILLDEKNRAKVADFGLSRLAPVPDVEGVVPGHVSTVVKGTPGYLDPEYFLTHKLTDKSDVYSFGVVLLEIITGMQPISHGKNIVREVNIAYEAGMVLSVVDPRMGSYASEALEPLVRLAVACCKDDPDARPSMAEVVKDLEDILRVTPWADSLNSFESSEVELKDMKKERNQISSNPYISSDMDGDLMSRTIPNIAPR